MAKQTGGNRINGQVDLWKRWRWSNIPPSIN